jgi:hypothetical protein
MSDTPTPRTDAAIGNAQDKSWMDGSLCRQLERELAAVTKELAEVQGENTRLRAALAQSSGACVYCSLPKEQWVACQSGFPGCARADDAMGCPELGASMERDEALARIKRLEEALNEIAKPDALLDANSGAFGAFAARRMQEQARAAIAQAKEAR